MGTTAGKGLENASRYPVPKEQGWGGAVEGRLGAYSEGIITVVRKHAGWQGEGIDNSRKGEPPLFQFQSSER